MVDVAEELARENRPRRITDQIVGCGTSVGANLSEADEAVSRPDFCKILGIVIKELNECRFWLRFVAKRQWIASQRLVSLEREALELKTILGAMLTRTRHKAKL